MATPAGTVFTPRRLLLLFCCINMLVYLDRGVISSNGVNGAATQPGRPGTGIQVGNVDCSESCRPEYIHAFRHLRC